MKKERTRRRRLLALASEHSQYQPLLPEVVKGKCQPPSTSHVCSLVTTQPQILFQCNCHLTFDSIRAAQVHVNQTIEEPNYDVLLRGSIKQAVKYVRKFKDWYLECHDERYRTRVIDICRSIFPNLRPWSFRKWFCINISTGKGGCICCYTRDCRTLPGAGQGQRDKAKQLRMNVSGLQYVSTMSHEIIKQHEKNFLAFFPIHQIQMKGERYEGNATGGGPVEHYEHLLNTNPHCLEKFNPKALNSPSEMPFVHNFHYDPYGGIYLCTCKMKFEDINSAKQHLNNANEKPSIGKFMSFRNPCNSLKYACKFPNWYISAENVKVRQRIQNIIESFQTKAKRLPIMQHSWACYNLYHQVFGCQKCFANCKNNSRCFGNITKRLASIEKARGNTFKLHCDTSTHQRLHYSDCADSSSESEIEDQEAVQGEVIHLTGIPTEASYHQCQFSGLIWTCECGKQFEKYKHARRHVQNNINYSLTDILKLNCLNAQHEMLKYSNLYLNMGFDEQATDTCYLIKKFKYRQNYQRFWWASINFAKRSIGCSICWEFNKCSTKCPIINKSLSLNSCSVPSLNQHEKSQVHQGILTSLKFRKRKIEKKIEIHKRKKRRLCSGYQSGLCIDCGWFTDLEINITENHPCKLSVTNIIKKVADDLLISHLKENCGSKLSNIEISQQIKQFQCMKTIRECKEIFGIRSNLLWEKIESDTNVPINKSPKKSAFRFDSPNQDGRTCLESLSSLSADSSDSNGPISRHGGQRKAENMRPDLFFNEECKSVERSRSVERRQSLRKRQRVRDRSVSRSPKKKKLNPTKIETSQQEFTTGDEKSCSSSPFRTQKSSTINHDLKSDVHQLNSHLPTPKEFRLSYDLPIIDTKREPQDAFILPKNISNPFLSSNICTKNEMQNDHAKSMIDLPSLSSTLPSPTSFSPSLSMTTSKIKNNNFHSDNNNNTTNSNNHQIIHYQSPFLKTKTTTTISSSNLSINDQFNAASDLQLPILEKINQKEICCSSNLPPPNKICSNNSIVSNPFLVQQDDEKDEEIDVLCQQNQGIQRIKSNCQPDVRWRYQSYFYIALQTKWGYENLWSKSKFQDMLKEMYQVDDRVDIYTWAHRLVLRNMKDCKKEDSVWLKLEEKAKLQSQIWMNSPDVVPQWLNRTISVLWTMEDTSNRGTIIEVRKDEIKIQYTEDDYCEFLKVDSNLNFCFEQFSSEKWWLNEKVDVQWDGKHEWYEGKIEGILPNAATVRYGDNSTEDLTLGKHYFYFICDKIKKIYPRTSRIFEDLFKSPNLTTIPSTLNTNYENNSYQNFSSSIISSSFDNNTKSNNIKNKNNTIKKNNSSSSSSSMMLSSSLDIFSTNSNTSTLNTINSSLHHSNTTINSSLHHSNTTIISTHDHQHQNLRSMPLTTRTNLPESTSSSNNIVKKEKVENLYLPNFDKRISYEIKDELSVVAGVAVPSSNFTNHERKISSGGRNFRKNLNTTYTSLSHQARLREELLQNQMQKDLQYEIKNYLPENELIDLQREYFNQGIVFEEMDRYKKNSKSFLACKISCLPCKTMNEENVYFAQGLMSIKNSSLSLKNHCFPTPSVKFRKHSRNVSLWMGRNRPGLARRRTLGKATSAKAGKQ